MNRREDFQLELNAILESSPLGILFSRNRSLRQANELCADIFGYRLDEFIGQPGTMLYPSVAAYDAMGAEASPVLADGLSYQTETQMKRKDGSLIWCRMTAKAVNPQRTQEGTLWIVEDITAARESAARAQRAFEEQQMIFDNAAVGILFARDHVVQRCNRKLAEIYGYAPEEMVGRSARLLYLNEQDYQRASQDAEQVLMAGGVYRDDLRARHHSGDSIWVRLTVRRSLDVATDSSADQSNDTVWIVEDVTEHHRAEEELLRAQEELEQRVVERTALLEKENTQLQGEVLERMESEQRVWHLAHHDGLTGLPNRTLLHDRLEQSLAQARRSQERVAVMFLDLDRFKSINDTLGHDVGDELLKHVAQRLSDVVRAVDTVSRLGGDEFVVLLSEISSPDDAVQVAEKILQALATPVSIKGTSLHATPSIGVGIFPDDGEEVFALLKSADTAMYHAKAKGRNNFQFFDPQMNAAASSLASLEHRLKRAIELGQICLHYQPIVDTAKSTVCGIEALVRWNDPDHGLRLPEKFLHVAEESGLSLALGDWVVAAALRQNWQWQQSGRPLVPIAINLSKRQFLQPGLVEKIARLLAESGQPAHLLELEMTEAVVMHDLKESSVRLTALAKMGVRLSVDDFGIGCSSLYHLKKLPLHRLKIAQQFVHDAVADADAAAVIKASIGLARNLGMDVLAVAVETGAQWQILTDLGCEKAQGFLFCRPVDAVEAEAIFVPEQTCRP